MKLFDLHDFSAHAASMGFALVINERTGITQTTPLASQPANQPGGVGFIAREDREMIKMNGAVIRVKAGTKLFVTQPGTLYSGSEIGGPRANGIYVLVGLKAPHARYATGYMALSNIANPANTQTRVAHGAEAQASFAERLATAIGPGFKLISSAPMSSQAPDVVGSVNGQDVQFEIKGRNSQSSHITFFDRSIRRGGNDPMLNDVSAALTQGKLNNFEQMIDAYRKKNKAVGFPGDKGAPPSGKLPPEFRVSDDQALFTSVRQHLIDHFAQAGDNYFAVVNRDTNQTEIFWTGAGQNPLNAPVFPQLIFVLLDTYGGAYKGAMRVAMKVKLDPSARGLKV